ncbi:MAG: hypothetical protein ACJA0E_000413 [Bermanella sp.]
MNITFGNSVNTGQASNVQVSDARNGVAVPAASENLDSTSFTPVDEAQKSGRPQQEGSDKGSESRLAADQVRVERREQARVQRDQQDEQQADSRQQKDIDQSQSERQVDARRQQDAQEQRQLEVELKQIQQLAERDREVRTHEQAHKSVGGQYAGAISLSYERGPDGKNYAVAGEVSIDTGPVVGNPQATLDKAETIRRAALAPAEPSNQDRRVASEAVLMSIEARADIQKIKSEAITEKAATDDGEEVKDLSSEERLAADKKSEQEQQDKLEKQKPGVDVQVLNERLSRIQSQILEISQIDDKINSKVNLLDVAT